MAGKKLVTKTQAAAERVKQDSEKVRKFKAVDKLIAELKEGFDSLDARYKTEALAALGVGKRFFTCQRCGEVKTKEHFYQCTEPRCKSGLVSICRECAYDIAHPKDEDGNATSPTLESVDMALFYVNKPFLETVWNASLLEAANSSSKSQMSDVWSSYIKNISMQQYYALTYRQSDNYTGGKFSLDEIKAETPKNQEIVDMFEKNKSDVLRLLGYLPFEKEKLSDQPFLYAQLVGFLDASEEGNDDMMRTSSIISIVRGFLQQSQIDDLIAGLTRSATAAEQNVPVMKALQTMKRDITTQITKLAEESCISLKNNKNAVKGENTWSGKIKRIKDLNLRDGRYNGFDIETCKGMRQVQEISDASIMKQLALDESEWSDMVASMRSENTSLRREKDAYKEINRILLQENIDLKDFLSDNGFNVDVNLKDVKDLYSVFGDMSGDDTVVLADDEVEVVNDE